MTSTETNPFAARVRAATLLVLFVIWMSPDAAHAVTLNVPTSHPRIWFGAADRLQQARAYHQSAPLARPTYDSFNRAGTNYLRALHGVVTNDAQSCVLAMRGDPGGQASDTGLIGAVLPTTVGAFRDAIRQDGEAWLAVYDWCNGVLTEAERTTLIDRWNGYLVRERDDKTIGHHGEEASNYWSGRVRNFLLWGIASYHENPQAQSWINEALDTRMGIWFAEWYQAFGKGGVFPEGSDYGIVSLAYPMMPFASAADFGFDPFAQTPYFTEAIYALIYGATPGPSTIAGSTRTEYSFFPFGDDQHFHEGGGINTRSYLGDFAKFMGVRALGTGNSKHALAWLMQSQARAQWLTRALAAPASAPGDLNDLPLDYYAPGAGVMAMRTGHDANATAVHLQLGTPNGMSHRHLDAGNFQMWRKGRWVTRESAGYSDRILALGANPGGNTVDTDHPVAHNTLLMQGYTTGRWIGDGPWPGRPNDDQPLEFPQVRRLQHESQFAFIATDYSSAYRSGVDTRLDWPATDKAIREFLFIRPLQALIILDRTRGSSDSQRPFYFTSSWLFNDPSLGQPAFHLDSQNIERHFIMHFETPPSVTGNRVHASIGNQTNELITLLPTTPDWRVVNEDVPADAQAGQHRLEIRQRGSTEMYFLNMVTSYDPGEAAITATLVDNGSSWSLSLSHPTRGIATVHLQKGMVSAGGSVQIGSDPSMPLAEGVQGITVTSTGPVWESPALFRNGFE